MCWGSRGWWAGRPVRASRRGRPRAGAGSAHGGLGAPGGGRGGDPRPGGVVRGTGGPGGPVTLVAPRATEVTDAGGGGRQPGCGGREQRGRQKRGEFPP